MISKSPVPPKRKTVRLGIYCLSREKKMNVPGARGIRQYKQDTRRNVWVHNVKPVISVAQPLSFCSIDLPASQLFIAGTAQGASFPNAGCCSSLRHPFLFLHQTDHQPRPQTHSPRSAMIFLFPVKRHLECRWEQMTFHFEADYYFTWKGQCYTISLSHSSELRNKMNYWQTRAIDTNCTL